MSSKAKALKIFFWTLALMLVSAPSYADWAVGVSVGGPEHHHRDWDRHEWEEHHRWHDHPDWGYHERFLPPDCSRVWVDGAVYHYCDGLYYRYAGYGDYVLVDPPVGAYVRAIPPDFQAVVIDDRTYYTSDGVYYVWTSGGGYRVVSQPVVYAPPPQPVVVTTPVPTQGEFTVNIPNKDGVSYTPVVIRRSGNGYTGPQGEFYPTFPTVAQLKTMYGK